MSDTENLTALLRYAEAEHGPLGWRRVSLQSVPEVGAMWWSDRSGGGLSDECVREASGFVAMPDDPDAWVLAKVRAEAWLAAKRLRALIAKMTDRADAIEAMLREGGA